MSGVFSLGIGTVGRIRSTNTQAKAGSFGWTPACVRETGVRWVLKYENGVAVFAAPTRHPCAGTLLSGINLSDVQFSLYIQSETGF